MLLSLDVRDMLIIDRLSLEFQPGLNVLTGETGAGKSILLDALGFVLGWRGRADLVRAGANTGEVSAAFWLSEEHPARAVLEEAELPVGDELILRRTATREGRKTARVNDVRVSGEVLRRLSDSLLELHGQHDDRGLLNPRGHRTLLDDYAGAGKALATCRAAWGARGKAMKDLEALEARLAALAEEEDFLRHAAEEIKRLAPEIGEDETLDARRRLMQAGERLQGGVAKAGEAIGPGGAEALVVDAVRWLEEAATDLGGETTEALEALSRALTEIGEGQGAVARLLDKVTFDPSELEHVEERLFALRALARKHGVPADDLAAFGETLRARLDELESGVTGVEAARAALAGAEADYVKAAEALSAKRKKAATALDTAMAKELAPLKLERAVFETQLGESEASAEGTDRVQFTVATNPGAPSGPLDRIASGGELSRFLLALKVCLTGGASGQTLIFDEIDRGVGGATADAVGRRLAALAEGGQVLVVTHSPQVAARGGYHWRVAKAVENDRTLSKVVALDADARVDEIARMLAGDKITEEARGAARALLAG